MFQSTGNNLLIKKKLQRPFDSLLLVLLASKLIDSEKKRFPMAAIYSLYIINKSGGLIFYKVPSLFSLLSASLIENQEYFYWKKIFFFSEKIRIMDLLGEWIRMTAWEWRVYGIRCTRSLNSYRQPQAVLASNSLKLTLLISIASNLSLVFFFPFINCLNAVFFLNRWAFLHCRANSIYKRIWMEIMKGKFRKRMQFEEQSWLVKCTLTLPFVLWREILASDVIYVHFPFNYNPK